LCAYDPQSSEITFRTAIEPRSPISQGWLRVSQRAVDPARSTEYFPYHPHDKREPLTPGQVYEVDVEIWPMSLWLSKGSRLTLTIQGKDFERMGETGPNRGVGWMTHDDPSDRPVAIFGGTNTLHTGGERRSYLLLPRLPTV
jgi:predicted acyl esterase